MERLLQGDVGSGKTVVALYALLRAVEGGHRGALMAPTETLAEQHFLTVEAICSKLDVTCGLLTSSVAKRDRARAIEASVVVGTHALIQEGVDLADLAVAVVDEQHRFGVSQRQALTAASEAARAPHDRDAHSPNARAHGLRRPLRERDHGASRRPAPDRDELGDGGAELRGVHAL